MKKLLLTILFSTILATQAQAANIAVVNLQKIMQDSKAASAVRNQVKSKQQSFQGEIEAKEKALINEDKQLASIQSKTDKAEFAKKVNDFRQKTATAQQAIQDKRAKLDKAVTQALATIQDKVIAITGEVAKEKSLDMVLSNSTIIYSGGQSTDITDEVLAKLDSQLPNVTVNF